MGSKIDQWARDSQEEKAKNFDDWEQIIQDLDDAFPFLCCSYRDGKVFYDCPSCEKETELKEWAELLTEVNCVGPIDESGFICGRSPYCLP